MGTTTSSRTTKSKANKAAIAKIAEDAAKKAARKTATKVAKEESTKVAAKVGAQAALNPDYDPQDYNDEEDFDEEYASFDSEDDIDNDDYTPSGRGLFSSSYSHSNQEDDDNDDDDLSENVKTPDIFAYGTDLMTKGTPIRFQIKKNGQFLTTIRKPYSEDKLQEEHGEGHYTVILRNDSKGTFIKQQSFAIAAPPQAVIQMKEKEIVQKQEEKIDKMFETFGQMQQRMQEAQSELVERLLVEQRERQEKEEERRREERELMKEQEMANQNLLATVLQTTLSKRDDGGSMATILQVMQQQQNQTTQMIMEMNKNSMLMIQEMRRDSQAMMEKITNMSQEQAREFRQQLSDMSNKKGDGFDPVEMFRMLQDTRESGFNFGLKLQQMAKEMAGDMDGTPAQPKGIVESLLDNLGKVAPLLLASQGGQNANAAQYFPQQAQPAPAKPQLIPAPPAPSYKKPTPVQAQPVAKSQPVAQTVARPVAQPAPTPKTVVAQAKPVNSSENVKKGGAKKTTTVTNVASNPENAKIAEDAQRKDQVINTCVPLIGHALQNSLSSGVLGEATINALGQQGITVQDAVKLVSGQDIFDLAFKKFNLPDVPELRAYLKDYHDYLQQKASA